MDGQEKDITELEEKEQQSIVGGELDGDNSILNNSGVIYCAVCGTYHLPGKHTIYGFSALHD